MADDDSVHTAIKQSAFENLLGKIKKPSDQMDAAKESLGGLIAKAVENDNLHAASFGKIRALHKMKPAKRAEWLFHFDTMREMLEQAGKAWAQDELPLGDRDDDGEGETDETIRGENPPDDATPATEAAPGPGDDKKDLRPRFKRHEGAGPEGEKGRVEGKPQGSKPLH